jgi:ATP-dependent DNA helicase RecQ
LKKYIKNIANDELKDTLVELLRLNGASIFLTNSRIEIEKLSEVLDKNSEQIKEELEELNTFGIIEFDKPSFDPSYELSIPRINDKYLNLDFSGIEKAKNLAIKKLDMMMDFVFTEECRMKFILDYFGENLNSFKCGKCDICTNKLEKSVSDDFIIEKILESIEEFEEGISKNDFVNLLIGDESSNLFTSTFYGVCGFYNKFEIANTLELLISNRKIDFSSGKVKSIKTKEAEFDNIIDLYNILKTVRAEAGRKFNQLPEVICPDNVLKEIAEAKPNSIQSLLKVKGFNQRMFNKFGEEILETINQFNSDRDISKIPSELKRTFDLVQNRYKLEEISSALNMSDSIISMQIESMLKFYPDMEISYLIDHKKIDKINEVLSTGLRDLKSIKEKLNGNVNYAEIRIVMAKQKLNY